MKTTLPVRRAVAAMRAYHPPLEGRADKLRLDFNENTVGCSPAVRRALARLSRHDVATYPEYGKTCSRLASFFGVRADEMLLTNGTDEALRLVLDVFVEPADTVLQVEPTFAMYRFYSELAGARLVALRYAATMEFPLDEVLRALRTSRARVFFLANPNNPTGTLVERSALRRILECAPRTLLVVDEAYFEFCGLTVLGWIRRYPNLVVLRTFSKGMGLAGLRFGCLFANRRLAATLRKAHSPYSVNSAALVAAQAAVRDAGFVRRYAREVSRSRRELRQALGRMGIPAFQSGGNFVLADFGRRASAILRALRQRGILLRDRRSDFDRSGYVRITVGTRTQTRRLLTVLEELWRP